MSILGPKEAFVTEYNVPPSQHAMIRVGAGGVVDVFAVTAEGLDAFKESRAFAPIASSSVKTSHELIVRLPPVTKWYLIVQNPLSGSVEVTYTVVSLTTGPASPVGPLGPTGVTGSYVTSNSPRRS